MTRAQGKHREFSLNQSVATLIHSLRESNVVSGVCLSISFLVTPFGTGIFVIWLESSVGKRAVFD